MLSELSIKNFAIIDDLTIRFSDGLTIFSGETGAGKSIIINAVNLLLGSRATARMVRTGAEAAELSALFHLPKNSPAREVLSANGHEESDHLLIRRIISAANRHKVYINDRLATMQLLSAVTDNLASISGQHEHQRLLKESRHLFFLDQFAGLMPLRREVYQEYHALSSLIQKRDELSRSRRHQDEHLELLQYQKQEIEDAAISPGEDDELKEEHARIKNAAYLYQTVGDGIETLYNADGAVAERLAEVAKSLERAAAIDAGLSPAAESLADIAVRIEDATNELRARLDAIHFDERRLEEIEARLDLLTRLKRKYGGDLQAVLAYQEKIVQELSGYDSLEAAVSETEAAIEKHQERLVPLCHELSGRRGEAAEKLGGRMENELESLKMQNTRFVVSLEKNREKDPPPGLLLNGEAVTETGAESACFMIAPNPGEALRPLSAIASGGELSRVILALKAIMANSDTPGTLIFDEVDAGIGGEVAEMVGKKLSSLARVHQVVCITHLAQIAKFGDHHYKISKQTERKRTRTRIAQLSGEERVEETARMISGADITQTTRRHAREMLSGPNRTTGAN
jgi:DNA repair protein RecN (Recombination protein N)